MNPQLPLEDILIPDAPGLWPLAPGWYLLALVILLILGSAAWLGLNAWRRRRWKRQALADLKLLSGSDNASVNNLNGLLKRATACYWPAERVANLHGQSWLTFLSDALPPRKRDLAAHLAPLGSERRFAPGSADNGATPKSSELLDAASQWLTHALPPGKKTLQAAGRREQQLQPPTEISPLEPEQRNA